jgi:hypothetical protein
MVPYFFSSHKLKDRKQHVTTVLDTADQIMLIQRTYVRTYGRYEFLFKLKNAQIKTVNAQIKNLILQPAYLHPQFASALNVLLVLIPLIT